MPYLGSRQILSRRQHGPNKRCALNYDVHLITRFNGIFTTCEECVLTLTDHCSIIMGVTVASVNDVAVRTGE